MKPNLLHINSVSCLEEFIQVNNNITYSWPAKSYSVGIPVRNLEENQKFNCNPTYTVPFISPYHPLGEIVCINLAAKYTHNSNSVSVYYSMQRNEDVFDVNSEDDSYTIKYHHVLIPTGDGVKTGKLYFSEIGNPAYSAVQDIGMSVSDLVLSPLTKSPFVYDKIKEVKNNTNASYSFESRYIDKHINQLIITIHVIASDILLKKIEEVLNKYENNCKLDSLKSEINDELIFLDSIEAYQKYVTFLEKNNVDYRGVIKTSSDKNIHIDRMLPYNQILTNTAHLKNTAVELDNKNNVKDVIEKYDGVDIGQLIGENPCIKDLLSNVFLSLTQDDISKLEEDMIIKIIGQIMNIFLKGEKLNLDYDDKFINLIQRLMLKLETDTNEKSQQITCQLNNYNLLHPTDFSVPLTHILLFCSHAKEKEKQEQLIRFFNYLIVSEYEYSDKTRFIDYILPSTKEGTLHFAIKYGHIQIAGILTMNDGNILQRDANDITPLLLFLINIENIINKQPKETINMFLKYLDRWFAKHKDKEIIFNEVEKEKIIQHANIKNNNGKTLMDIIDENNFSNIKANILLANRLSSIDNNNPYQFFQKSSDNKDNAPFNQSSVKGPSI